MAKGYISEFINGGRIVSHGVLSIDMLRNGCGIPHGGLFTIYIRPKVTIEDVDIVLPVRLYQDEEMNDAPFAFNEWSPLLIKEIGKLSDTQVELLRNCDVFFGSGSYINTLDNG